jgi:hypothetical protein
MLPAARQTGCNADIANQAELFRHQWAPLWRLLGAAHYSLPSGRGGNPALISTFSCGCRCNNTLN